jgi:hypothetical protein
MVACAAALFIFSKIEAAYSKEYAASSIMRSEAA